MQNKPEATTWVRAQYNEESLPDWIGRLEGDVDYEAILKQAGVELSYSSDHGVNVRDVNVHDDESDNDSDIAEGVPPTHPRTTVANHTLTQTDMSRHKQTRTDSNRHKQSTHMEETRKETQTDTERDTDRHGKRHEQSRMSHRRSQGRSRHHHL
jgi:hypothetical protein